MDKILPSWFTTIHQLSSVSRYSRDNMTQRESVLEHTGFVGLFALFLAKKLEKDVLSQNQDFIGIDFEELLTRALVHDIDETILGDVSRTTKYYKPEIKEMFSKIESESVISLSEFIGIDVARPWHRAKDGTLEGYILKLTDLAAVVFAVWREVTLLGNLSMLRVAEEVEQFLIKFKLPHNDKLNEFFGGIIEELKSINRMALDKHQDLLKNNRDMLFSFPTFERKE
jgi:5'-deoxynucleotidase YfbR-like HD superfamily hydrolase